MSNHIIDSNQLNEGTSDIQLMQIMQYEEMEFCLRQYYGEKYPKGCDITVPDDTEKSIYYGIVLKRKCVGFARVINENTEYEKIVGGRIWKLTHAMVFPEYRKKGIYKSLLRLLTDEYGVNVLSIPNDDINNYRDFYIEQGFPLVGIGLTVAEDGIQYGIGFHRDIEQSIRAHVGCVDDIASANEQDSGEGEANIRLPPTFNPSHVNLQDALVATEKRRWVRRYMAEACGGAEIDALLMLEDLYVDMPDSTLYIAEIDGEEVGCIMLIDDTNDYQGIYFGKVEHITLLYIRPDCRRQGLMTAIINKVTSDGFCVKSMALTTTLLYEHAQYVQELGFTYGYKSMAENTSHVFIDSFKEFAKTRRADLESKSETLDFSEEVIFNDLKAA